MEVPGQSKVLFTNFAESAIWSLGALRVLLALSLVFHSSRILNVLFHDLCGLLLANVQYDSQTASGTHHFLTAGKYA